MTRVPEALQEKWDKILARHGLDWYVPSTAEDASKARAKGKAFREYRKLQRELKKGRSSQRSSGAIPTS